MPSEWQSLTTLTGGASMLVERVRLKDSGVALEGSFELPPLAALPAEDQVFVAAFVRSHGSIKEMERLFGVSYPTIKNRLNRIGELLPTFEAQTAAPSSDTSELLDRLERGELSARDVIARMRSHHD
ncbi:MAG: DUF2089 family protein [Vicinamibacterales bacterium]